MTVLSTSPKIILGTQYFMYFGIMGVFLPYFNLYLYHLGLSGFQIGMVSAARSLTLIFFPLLWSLLADRLQIRRSVYLLCLLISTAVWTLFLHVHDFTGILIISICYGIFYAPLIAFLEAFTMDLLGRHKTAYGRVRLWGSLSFIAMVMLTGKLVDMYSVRMVVGMILAGSLLQTLFATQIPTVIIPPLPSIKAGLVHFRRGRTIVFLLAATLMLMSHGTYYAFFSIYLESLGYGVIFIGLAWMVASAAEIVVMLNSKHLLRRFRMESLLCFSFAVATLRWLLLGEITSPAGLILVQCLHAFTYGLFHVTSILYMDAAMPEESKTIGQAVNNSLTYGAGLMAGFLLSGYLYARLTMDTLFAISALIALCAGIIFVASHWFWGVWQNQERSGTARW